MIYRTKSVLILILLISTIASVRWTGIVCDGNDNLFMAYTHVAHDCIIGNNVIMANGASLAGHVHLCDNAILGGFTLVHQFTQIGTFSFSAMGSAITQDVPPYVMV